MKKPSSDFIFKILIIAIAAFAVFNFSLISSLFETLKKIFQPIIIGIVLALAMSVPLNFFHDKVYKKITRPKLKEFLSLTTTFAIFGGFIALMCVLIIPQCVHSVKEILNGITDGNLLNTLKNTQIYEYFGDSLNKAYSFITKQISQYVPQIIGFMQDLFTGIYNIVFGVIIAAMLLANRKNVKEQLKKFIFLIFKERNLKVHAFLHNAVVKFSKYLGGQLTEAFILGAACYLTMVILKVPYAALVSLIIGFVNLIPIIGAYIGGAASFIMIFAVNPGKAFVFLIAVLILQQVESFTTYPMIVGKYVGLNGFWITVSVIIWGGIFGFWGLFLGVPLSAFLFDIFENVYKKKKEEFKFIALNKK